VEFGQEYLGKHETKKQIISRRSKENERKWRTNEG
jgi:hypothetical protein